MDRIHISFYYFERRILKFYSFKQFNSCEILRKERETGTFELNFF